MLNTNDYLAIAGDPRIVEAEVRALRRYGHGDTVSRVFSHHHENVLRTFERRVASLTRGEDAVLCASGYTANVGLLQAIAQPDTPIYLDIKAHFSLWEGVSSAKAVGRPFRHNDVEHLERLIEKNGPGIVVIDSLYSQDGAFGRIRDFAAVAREHGCVFVVDETHSFGTHGPDGAGLVAELGLEGEVHFRTIGMSKAVASRGGVVVCSERNAEYLRYHAYPLIFSTSVMPHEVAGFDAALDIFRDDPWRRVKLHENHAYLRAAIADLGYNVDMSDSQIIALEPGEMSYLFVLRDALESRGIIGSPFVPPATPSRRCNIRFSLNCVVSREQLDRTIAVCRDIRDEVRLKEWRSTRKAPLAQSATTVGVPSEDRSAASVL
jgi:CAI-1 autoinducer synthase